MIRAILYGLVFLISVVVSARVHSWRMRQSVLLIGSCVLYLTWGKWFALVLLASTVMNFVLGNWLRRKPSGAVLSAGILFNLVMLSSFKYIPNLTVSFPFSSLHRFSHLALPLGISFWTFQAMSYLFDVYSGEELYPSFFEFALYMVFFPVVISGPICRLREMLPQFRSERTTPSGEIGRGLGRIATGVFMMQLARLLGQGILAGDGVNSGFDHATHWTGLDVWCLAIGYGLQLFLDFAGYSHIAIGAANALGFTLPENFARPFQSTSPSIFWTRWHMSLSFWIRDYVFLPLAMVRREAWWRNLSLVISMVLFGLWHKASVLFVLWGCYHGVILVLHRQIQQLQRRFGWTPPTVPWTAISWIVTITFVSLGWIFFRANTLVEARQMLSAAASPAGYLSHSLSGSLYILVMTLASGYAVVLLMIEALESYSVESRISTPPSSSGIIDLMARNRWFWIPPLYLLALLVVLVVTHTPGVEPAQLMYRNF